MARLALFLVLCAGLRVESIERKFPAELQKFEIANNEMVIEGTENRKKRDQPKTDTSNSRFIQFEKNTTGDSIFWRDNAETRNRGQVPTVTKVLYHGIYPSLNVTVPVNSSYVGRYRLKRGTDREQRVTETRRRREEPEPTKMGSQYVPNTAEIKRRSTTLENKQGLRTPQAERNAIGTHYQRAIHLPHTSRPYQYSTANQTQGISQYRTQYLPATADYHGDPENKGRVKLISVGYYNVNESTAELRAYRNRKHHRAKRDHWAWLDKVFKTIWTLKNPESQENQQPHSEPLIAEDNEQVQETYGYSSNGHGHSVDRIAPVENTLSQSPDAINGHIKTPLTVGKEPFSATQTQNPIEYEESPHTGLDDQHQEEEPAARETHEDEEIPLPKDGPVLIQAPIRRIAINDRIETPLTVGKEQFSASQTQNHNEYEESPHTGIDYQHHEEEPTARETHEDEEIPLPKDGPVLIQAPIRRIACRPPKRLARGRCRTVW